MLLVKANFSLFSYSVFLVFEIKTLKLKLNGCQAFIKSFKISLSFGCSI